MTLEWRSPMIPPDRPENACLYSDTGMIVGYVSKFDTKLGPKYMGFWTQRRSADAHGYDFVPTPEMDTLEDAKAVVLASYRLDPRRWDSIFKT